MFRIDDTRWPLVLFTAEGLLSDDELDHMLRSHSKLFDRKQPFIQLCDYRRGKAFNAAQMRKIAAWMEQHRQQLSTYCLGSAYVLGSPLLRGVLKALFWVAPPPVSYTVCNTVQEGLTWSREQLSKAGLTLANVAGLG